MSLSQQVVAGSMEIVSEVFMGLRSDLLAATGTIEFTRKPDFTVVTEWDVRVESTLQDAIAKVYPELGFQGEESGKHGDETTYWLVDPIDGTSSFVRGLYYATNMAALVHEGVVVASVIYDFHHDFLYTAIKGEGAFKNGVPIAVNNQRTRGDYVIYSLTRDAFPLIREGLQELGMRTLLPMGAAGHAYLMLAEGKIDGVVVLRTGTGLHDNAPGVLLAEEAGAEMLQYDDEQGVYRHEFIIGSPVVVDAIEKSGLI